MIKTQVQIPDDLYQKAKQVAKEREISFAEVTRRGLEYITSVYLTVDQDAWDLPLVGEPSSPYVTQKEIQEVLDHDRELRG